MKRFWDEEKLKIIELFQTKLNTGNNLRALGSKKKIGKADKTDYHIFHKCY
jgi:hypothetical protein